MSQYFSLHSDNPQPRLIRQAADILRKGGVIAYPTDSSYALACCIDNKQGLETIKRIRQLDDKHRFSLICTDLTQVSRFVKVGNDAHRLIKHLTPGAFTFILDATKEVPRRATHPKAKTVGIRIPNSAVALALIEVLNEPLLSTTLILPDTTEAISDPYDIREQLAHDLDLILETGIINYQATTIISCVDGHVEIIRQGVAKAPMLM